MSKHLDYETWIRHLEEKEKEKHPPSESERLKLWVALLERYADIYQM